MRLLISICSGPLATGVIGGSNLQFQCAPCGACYAQFLLCMCKYKLWCRPKSGCVTQGAITLAACENLYIQAATRVCSQRVWTVSAAGQGYEPGGTAVRLARSCPGANQSVLFTPRVQAPVFPSWYGQESKTLKSCPCLHSCFLPIRLAQLPRRVCLPCPFLRAQHQPVAVCDRCPLGRLAPCRLQARSPELGAGAAAGGDPGGSGRAGL